MQNKLTPEEQMALENLRKIRAEIQKIQRESDKLMMETRWYPFVVASAMIGTVIALTKLFL